MNEKILQPIFRETPAIRERLQSIERSAWLLGRVPLAQKYEPWFRRDVAVRRATATTAIEGAALREEQVSELFRKGATGKPSVDELANLNAARAYEFVDYLSDQADVPVDDLAIRQLNRYFLAGMAETLTPGIYRKGQTRVGISMPPDQGDVPELMRQLVTWLDAKDAVNPILRAALAHIEFVAIHPFWDGNGRVARALATLILQRSSFNFRKLLSFDRYMFSVRDSYYIPVIEQTVGERYTPGYDATPWLEFFALAIDTEAARLVEELAEWNTLMQALQARYEAQDLNRRQIDGMAYTYRNGRITRPEYIEVTGAYPGTASRDLAQLAKKGLLVPEGATKGRVYSFNRDTLGPDWPQRPS